MPYKLFFQYPNGAKSHALVTDSKRDARQHLDYLLTEAEPRALAQQIIIMHNQEIIMEASPALEDEKIRTMPRWRKVGRVQQMHDPVSVSIYMPEAVKQFLLKRGNGTLAAGMKQVMLEVGGEDIVAAYSFDEAPHASV